MEPKDAIDLATSVGAPAAVAAALAKPIEKLIEVTASGIGALGRPVIELLTAHTGGRAALARQKYAHRLMVNELENQEALDALIAAKKDRELGSGKKLGDEGSPPELGPGETEVIFDVDSADEEAATQKMVTHQDQKRRANIVTVVAEAADGLPPDAKVSDDPVDDDWTARFFSYAQDVSSEQLQKLWGRILATEVTRPGAIPLRSLELLRNLSRDEAKLLERCVARMTDKWLHVPTRSNGLTPWEIRLLRDAGVLDSSHMTLAWMPTSPEVGAQRNPFGPGKATLDFLGPCRVELTVKSMPLLRVETLAISARPLANALIRLRNGIVADEAYLKSLCEEMGQDGNTAVIIRRDEASPAPEPPPPEAPASPPVDPEPGDT